MKLIYYVTIFTLSSFYMANAASTGSDEVVPGSIVETPKIPMSEAAAPVKGADNKVDVDIRSYSEKLTREKAKGDKASASLMDYYQGYITSLTELQTRINTSSTTVDISKETFRVHETNNMYAGGFS